MTGVREIATVVTPGANLRKSPGKHAERKDALTFGDKMLVLGRQYPGGYEWLRVRVTETKSGQGVGEEGWLFRGDVEVKVDVPSPAPPAPPKQDNSGEIIFWVLIVLIAIGLIVAFWR